MAGLVYYTDGSCDPNPGAGGYAVIRDSKPVALGSETVSTNNRMEGKAIQAALRDARGVPCQIFTDSQFWINVLTQWAPNWETNGWRRKKSGSGNTPIKNLDLVKEIYALYRQSQATLVWVRGHSNDQGNELADQWANTARCSPGSVSEWGAIPQK